MANIWQKAFSRIFWRNRDKGAPYTPLGESKLLPMDASIDEMDDRILVLNTTKADQSDLLTAFKSVSFNSATGVFTFTKFNDTTVTVDTDIEKIAINFDYDDDPTSAHYQNLIITLEDGTIKYVDMSALLTQYEFTDSTTIHFTVTNGIVSANVINGSITSDHLSPELNAKINNAEYYSEESEAWAVGQKNGQDVPSTDPRYHNNSKYYAEQAEASLSNTVRSFKGRNGAVSPTDGDYNIEQISPLNGAAVGQVPVVQNVGTAQEPVYKFGMQFVSGGGIGTCNSIEPFSLAFLVTVNAGFNVAIGSYLSVIFANDFYYSGGNPLRLSVNNQLYEVRINGESPVTGKTYVKSGYAGIFVYDGTYFQLIGTSGGGHVIQNQSGNAMAQEDAMQFLDAHLTDDPINGKTVVENIKEVDPADYDSTTDEGIIVCDDGEDAVIGPVSDDYVEVTADGNTTRRDLLNWLFNHCDTSKIRENAYIVYSGNGRIYHYEDINNGAYIFAWESIRATTIEKVCLQLNSSTSTEIDWTLATTGNTKDENYSYKPANGYKYTLHYGTSSGIVELNTEVSYSTAERKIGKWIDGSDLYEKTVNCGALPNATSKDISHGIAYISKIVEIKGYATNGILYLSLPFAGASATSGISVYANASNITFETGMNRSNFTESYVTLRYTKA